MTTKNDKSLWGIFFPVMAREAMGTRDPSLQPGDHGESLKGKDCCGRAVNTNLATPDMQPTNAVSFDLIGDWKKELFQCQELQLSKQLLRYTPEGKGCSNRKIKPPANALEDYCCTTPAPLLTLLAGWYEYIH